MRFIVFAHFRSGSGLLCDLLNLHPEIHCDYEILYPFLASRMKPRFFPLFLQGLVARTDAGAYGCNIKLDQLERVHPDPRRFMEERHREGWKIIYLRRVDILRAALSNFIASRHQRYSLPKEHAAAPVAKTHIECDELLNLLHWYQRIAEEEAEVLAALPHLALIYEQDLLAAPRHQATLDRVFDYLGLRGAPVESKSARTGSDRLADSIENYRAVVEFVGRTPYARFLNET